MVDFIEVKREKIELYEREIWKKFWIKKGYDPIYKELHYEIINEKERCGYINIIFDCGVAHITSIILDEKFRGKGIGHKVMEFIDDQANKNHCHKIRLETQKDLLPNAYHLYRKFGFQEESMLKNDFLGKDWVILSKFI